MTQNIYDNEEFFARYGELLRSREGLSGAPEWPALRALLPELRGTEAVDLGCGYGWFCRWARRHGASRVVGIDVSEKMLARARATTDDPAITYLGEDLERLTLPAASFALAYSSLALHYIEHLDALLAEVHRSLAPGGSLVFSVEHPIFMARSEPNWVLNAAGRKTWPVDRYLEEGPRAGEWLMTGVVKQHRTVATYVNMLLRAGFTLSRIEEWGPSDEQIAERPALAEERQRPPFLLIAARR